MKTTKKQILGALSLASLLGFFPVTSWAAPLDDDDEEEAENGDEAEEEEEEQDRWYAVVGGDVYTGIGGVLRGATVLCKNGKIEEIGHGIHLPEDTEKLDARGLRVYPGLVAIAATRRISQGLFGSDLPLPEDAFDASTEEEEGPRNLIAALTGHLEDEVILGEDEDDEEGYSGGDLQNDAADSFDPFSQYLVLALATGITTAEQGDTAMKLKRREIEGVAMREKYLNTISSGTPSSRRTAAEKFEAAAEYLRNYREWEKLGDDSVKEPSKKGIDGGMLNVLTGTTRARFNAHERGELLWLARLAQRFGFRPVVYGCREGWTVADELGRAGVTAVLSPRDRRFKDEELVRPGGSSIENAATLHASGVQVAIIPQNTSFDLGGITGRDLMHLPVEAAFAVRGGLPSQAALEAITLVPARVLGVDHRVGSIEVGKDGDLIVTDGDLLHYKTFVQYAVVDGKLVYDKEEEIYFAHIRPRPELPPLEDEEPAPPPEEESDDDDSEEDPPEDDEEGEGEGGEEGGGDDEEEDSGGDDEDS